MLAREYVIVVEGPDGRATRELCRTATTGHPLAGDEVLLDGVAYTVTRVRHQDDPDPPSERIYTIAWVYLRPLAGGAPRLPLPSSPDRPTHPTAPSVLPFTPPPRAHDGSVASIVLPATLVAVLVACGYREQATRYRAARRSTARLVRDGHGWIVEPLAPAAWWQASRRAKRAFAGAAALVMAGGLSASCAPARPALRPPQPRLPAARPALRSV
jgi:hypothetical protein